MAQMLIIAVAGLLLFMLILFAVLDAIGMAARWIGGASFDD